MLYVSHANNVEQLRAEVISDLNRRIEFLQRQYNNSPSAAMKSRFAVGLDELGNMLDFWTKLELAGRHHRKRTPKITPPEERPEEMPARG